MKVNSTTVYTENYGKGNTLSVKDETRFSSFGDPNGHKVPVHGLNIVAKDENDVVTADVFLAYAGLGSTPEERKEKVSKVIEEITRPQKNIPEDKYEDEDYICGRDSHEAYLY